MVQEIPGAGGKAMLVCSTGGHLTELLRLEAHFGAHPDSLWVTFDTPQSRQLLEGRRVLPLPYIGPRDLRKTIAAVPTLERVLRSEKFDAAISTGAAVATAALPLAAAHGTPTTYVESVCRLHGPSTTGKILERVPGIGLRTQHEGWESGRWETYPSILADFRGVAAPRRAPVRKVFVTLGTIQGYRFDSVVDAFLGTGLAGEDTVWQLGDTPRDDLPGQVHDYLTPGDFADAAREADLVITHAGVGTLMELLSMGVYPVQAVRRAVRGEHVDDHQTEIAELVNDLGVGIAVDGPDLTREVCEFAAAHRVVDQLDLQAAAA